MCRNVTALRGRCTRHLPCIGLGHLNMTIFGQCWLDQHTKCTTCIYMYPPSHALTHPHTHTPAANQIPRGRPWEVWWIPHQKVCWGHRPQYRTAHDAHRGYSLKANDQGLFPARDHVYSLKANDPKTQVYSLKGIMFIP